MCIVQATGVSGGGWARTLDLGMMSRVFYRCATTARFLLLLVKIKLCYFPTKPILVLNSKQAQISIIKAVI
jgi:hypothetical protein